MQTDRKLRKYPDDGFVQTFEAGEMDRNFAVKSALAVETAPITCHGFTFESTFRLILDEGRQSRWETYRGFRRCTACKTWTTSIPIQFSNRERLAVRVVQLEQHQAKRTLPTRQDALGR